MLGLQLLDSERGSFIIHTSGPNKERKAVNAFERFFSITQDSNLGRHGREFADSELERRVRSIAAAGRKRNKRVAPRSVMKFQFGLEKLLCYPVLR